MSALRARAAFTLERFLTDFVAGHDSTTTYKLLAKSIDAEERLLLTAGPGSNLEEIVRELNRLVMSEFNIALCPNPGTWEKPFTVLGVGAVCTTIPPLRRSRMNETAGPAGALNHRPALKRLATQIRRGNLPAYSMILDVGDRLEICWLLRPIESWRLESTVECVQFEMIAQLKADEALPASKTFMQMPGTVNWQNPGDPYPVKTIQYFPSRVYSPYQFPAASERAWINSPRKAPRRAYMTPESTRTFPGNSHQKTERRQ